MFIPGGLTFAVKGAVDEIDRKLSTYRRVKDLNVDVGNSVQNADVYIDIIDYVSTITIAPHNAAAFVITGTGLGISSSNLPNCGPFLSNFKDKTAPVYVTNNGTKEIGVMTITGSDNDILIAPASGTFSGSSSVTRPIA